MGNCIVCGCETEDFRCCVREENGEFFDDFQCEECTMKIVEKERKEWEDNFNEKVLPYLIENNFKVIVESDDKIEEFPIKNSDVMYCVDIIRKRMEAKGYYENWIDVHWEGYKDVDFEIVDYLCYALPHDKNGEYWCSYYLKLVGNNDIRLKKMYS